MTDSRGHLHPSRPWPVRLLWYVRCAGGPLRALRRWWYIRRALRPAVELAAGPVKLLGETEAEYRGRLARNAESR